VKIILFGATGMIGEGALIECLEDSRVTAVLALVRWPTGWTHDKLTELIHRDFTDYTAVEASLTGLDACLFCLGISAGGMSAADYRHITYDLALAAGEVLVRLNPGMSLCFISGAGTDPQSCQLWARVKGETEQALAALPWTDTRSRSWRTERSAVWVHRRRTERDTLARPKVDRDHDVSPADAVVGLSRL
jgi:uncharacterized protein YbjT (DUF2867 family)